MDTNQYRLRPLVEKAKYEGWQYKIFLEIPEKKGSQPMKNNLLERVYKKEFDTIVVPRLSDWSGSPAELPRELNELIASGTRVISSYENFDSSSLTGKLYMQVLIAMNESEESFDPPAKENGISNLKPVDYYNSVSKIPGTRISRERPAGLTDFRREVLPDKIEIPGKSLIPKVNSDSGKESAKSEPFDLVCLDEACSLTGYSRHTIYQLTVVCHMKVYLRR